VNDDMAYLAVSIHRPPPGGTGSRNFELPQIPKPPIDISRAGFTQRHIACLIPRDQRARRDMGRRHRCETSANGTGSWERCEIVESPNRRLSLFTQ